MNANLKSNKNLTDKTCSVLKSKCANLGTKNATITGNTNLSGMSSTSNSYTNANTILKRYKVVLDSDGNHIKGMGIYFKNVDEYMMKKNGEV